jgi:poly(3-hydroxybutyrate) depolymerase
MYNLYSNYYNNVLTPLNAMANLSLSIFPNNPLAEVIERSTRQYDKKEWEMAYSVEKDLPFCNLIKFGNPNGKKILLVAPMSGHYATLITPTIKAFIEDHEVYVTDWKNSRDISVDVGDFDFNSSIDYVVDFIKHIGTDTNVIAICQPCIQVLAAVTHLHHINGITPASMTLIAGPVDTRVGRTDVNEFADKYDIDWFEANVVHDVSPSFEGAGRSVYPGFMQLSAFVAMNPTSHFQKHCDFFSNLMLGKTDESDKHADFYDEYNAVMDLPANFYLETLDNVFMDQKLVKGEIEYKGNMLDLKAITDTKLFVIEGADDDICGVGQTKAAINFCSDELKTQYLLQSDVGHYGSWSGSKFRSDVAPAIIKFLC